MNIPDQTPLRMDPERTGKILLRTLNNLVKDHIEERKTKEDFYDEWIRRLLLLGLVEREGDCLPWKGPMDKDQEPFYYDPIMKENVPFLVLQYKLFQPNSRIFEDDGYLSLCQDHAAIQGYANLENFDDDDDDDFERIV